MLRLNQYIGDVNKFGAEKIDSIPFGNDSALYEYLNSLLGLFPKERIKIKKMVSNKDFPILFNVPDDNVFSVRLFLF